MGNAILMNRRNVDSYVPSLLQETQIFALWTIQDLKELLKRFHTQIHGFALVEAQFETIIAFKSSVADHVPLEQLFDILDNDHDGRIDGLELLGGIALCCHATFEEKARFCFELYDFNLNSLLSKKELAMMMMSCVCGLNLLTGGSEELEPDVAVYEGFADDAIARADLNADGQISYEEFIFWARSNRELMCGLEALNRIATEAKLDVQSDDSAPETDDNDSLFADSDPIALEVLEFIDDTTVNVKLPKLASLEVSSKGDQALSIVPWLGQLYEPTNYRKLKNSELGPDTNLELSWVFGNRNKSCINNVRYLLQASSEDRLIVYTVATVCIIYHVESKKQTFYLGHSQEVTALALHPNQQIVATADLKANIHLWTIDKGGNAVSLLVIHAMVKQGIQQLSFSPKGEKIAAVGMDNDHTICIYETSNGELISSAKGMSRPNTVFDIAYSGNGAEIAMVGKNQIKFFINVHTNKRHIDSKLGKIGSKGKRQIFCCVTYMHDEALVGCASGEIYRFKDTQCISMVQAHGVKEPVLCLSFNPFGGNVLSGGKDSIIKTWDGTLKEIGSPIDLSEDVDGDGKADTGSLNSAIISIQQNNDCILVATLGGDIFEVFLPKKQGMVHTINQLAWGHSEGELWGLAMHPSRDEFLTVGDDKTLRIWSLRSHEQINIRVMPTAARAVDYNQSGAIIAIGQIDGSISLMEANSPALRVFSTWKHTSKVINDIKFSPDDTILAAASADTNIYLYKAEDRKSFRRLAVCRGHSGAVTHLDFSANSQYVQSNGNDYSLLYWDISGNQVRQGSTMRDVKWNTYTCIFNWGVKGMWSIGADYTDINSCMALPDIGDFVCGDDFGKLKLYRYPSLSPGCIHQSYIGHAGHITAVRFNWSRRYLVSIGGRDRSIFVWKHDVELEESDDDFAGYSSSSSSATNSSGTEALQSMVIRKDHPEIGPRSLEQEAANLGWSVQDMKDMFAKSNSIGSVTSSSFIPTRGDENFSDVPVWRSCIVEPTKWNSVNGTTDVDITLQWVHGHRSFDCRNNVIYSAEGSIVYNAANLAIVYHKPSGKQNFLLGPHIDEVISITIHPAGQMFATGEAGRKSNIVIWDSKDLHVVAKLENVHRNGSALLAFNSNGRILASIGLDENNTLCIHDWMKNVMILSTPTHKDRVLCASFLVNDGINGLSSPPLSGESESTTTARDILVTGGQKYLKFWWWQGQNVQCQSAMWGNERKEKKSTILCVASTNRDICITGSAQGNLLIWKSFKLVCHVRKSIENYMDLSNGIDIPFFPIGGYPHQNSILAIWAVPGSVDLIEETFSECCVGYQRAARYLTGDRDGMICVWRLMIGKQGNPRLLLLKMFTLKDLSSQAKGNSIKSICERDGLILVATNSSEMFEIQDDSVPLLKMQHDSSVSVPNLLGTSGSSRKFSVIPVTPAGDQGKNTSVKIPAARISEGHSSGEVWGLAAHPSFPVYFTSGDDSSIKCWNLNPHRLISFAHLPEKARSIDINPKDLNIAVALNNGGILILNSEKFFKEKKSSSIEAQNDPYDVTNKLGLPLLEAPVGKGTISDNDKPPLLLSTSNQCIQVVKFSFDGNFLAAGGQDSKIYVFEVNNNKFVPLSGSPFSLHKPGSTITHIDFGISLNREISDAPFFYLEDFDREENKIVQYKVMNNKTPGIEIPVEQTTCSVPIERIVVQSCSSDGDIVFWSAANGIRVTSLSKVKDAFWSTQTSPYGWSVQGIWPVDSTSLNNSDILRVARSNSFDKVPVLAAVDIFGRVRLYNYPCVQAGAPDKCYRGHSSKVTNIVFSSDDNFVITTGGQDRCVFVWATDIQDEIRERSVFAIGNNKESVLNILLDDDSDNANSLQNLTLVAEVDEDFQINKVVPAAGDEHGAVKPWKSSIREPSNWKEPGNAEWSQPPSEHLDLAFVHGYRGWDCRNNLSYADNADCIIYHVAALGIVLNTRTQTQVLNHEHDDDILCLTVHPEGHIVASGEIGKFPKIVIWDANTGVSIRSITGHKKGVSHLSFANMGKMLVSCGMDDDRTVMVHDTHNGTLLGKGKAGRGVDIYALALAMSSQNFVTGGKNHVKFWELPSNSSSTGVELSSKTGIYNLKSVKARTVCSATFLGVDAVTGMNDGSILLWKDRSNTKAIPGHQGAVTAMTAFSTPNSNGQINNGGGKFRSLDARESGPRILSGGKDGFIHMWDIQFNKVWSLNLNESTPTSSGPQIQSLSARNNNVLIGTKAAEIYECSILGGSDICRHVAGHYQERAEVWGLDVHPKLPYFVTAGDDMTVRLWDGKLFRLEHCVTMEAKCRAVAYHPDGSQIAVAFYDGKLQVFSEDLKRVAAKVIVSSSWSQCLAYSPDGQILAVGCHDNVIYLLETKSYACLAKCKGHHSFITGLDFSEDGRVLQSVSGDYELLFWNARTGRQICSPTDVRDAEWRTITCTLGWSVQGIWPSDGDGTDVNTVDRSPNHKLLATGDDFHSVKLFKYPCYKEKAPFKQYKGHSEHVMKVKFSADGKYLYSVGGLDKAVLQFEIKE